MRLFVALPVPADVRDRGAAAVAALSARTSSAVDSAVRWTDPDGWHLTVAYLGLVDDDRLGEVAGVVDVVAATAPPMVLRTDAAGRFGRRVLWLGVEDEPAGAVAALGERVQTALAAVDLPVERRTVEPHITLARGRGRSGRVADDLVTALDVPPASWRAQTVQVWSSRTDPDGAVYTVEHETRLRGGD